MTASAVVSQEQHTQPPDLVAAVLRFQDLYRLQALEPNGPRKEAYTLQLCACQETLVSLLIDSLSHEARNWLYSGMGYDMQATPASYAAREDVIQSLAFSMYLYILDALPTIKVDPSKNLCAYLRRIARNGIADEHRQIYASVPPYSQTSTPPDPPLPGTSAAAMSPPAEQPSTDIHADVPEDNTSDPNNLNQTAQLIRAIYERQCWPVIRAFWHDTFSPEDWHIVKRRTQEPPEAFDGIAQQLGPGWTAAAARQRLHRIVQRTHAHLQTRGFIDEGGYAP